MWLLKSGFANLFCKDQESMLTSIRQCFSWSFKQGGYWIIPIYKSEQRRRNLGRMVLSSVFIGFFDCPRLACSNKRDSFLLNIYYFNGMFSMALQFKFQIFIFGHPQNSMCSSKLDRVLVNSCLFHNSLYCLNFVLDPEATHDLVLSDNGCQKSHAP